MDPVGVGLRAHPSPLVASSLITRCSSLADSSKQSAFQQLLDLLNEEGQVGLGEEEFGRGDAVMLDVRGMCLWWKLERLT